MWCDRCSENDRASLGTDEHPHSQWLVLCPACCAELDEDRAADALAEAEHRQRMAGPHGPVTRSRVRFGRGDAYANH